LYFIKSGTTGIADKYVLFLDNEPYYTRDEAVGDDVIVITLKKRFAAFDFNATQRRQERVCVPFFKTKLNICVGPSSIIFF
jgi:hypothetical protein